MPRRNKHLVMARTQAAAQNGIQTSKGHLRFNAHGSAMVDADIAGEIEHSAGLKGTGDVWTHEDVRTNHEMNYHDGVHNYFFTSPPKNGGNEFVWVETADGKTKVSRQVAEEEGLKIIQPRKRKHNGIHAK